MRLSHVTYIAGILAATLMMVPYMAHAQVTPGNLSNTVRPDVIQKQLNIRDQAPAVGGEPIITLEDEQGEKALDGDVTFVLRSITIEGATAFGEDELRKLYEDKLNTRISLADLNKIVASITSYYRNHGYILTRAVLPPQRTSLDEGNIKIQIIEGFVSNVSVVGDGADDPQIQAYSAKIRAAKPLDAETLERYLLLMDDLPGVEARAVLRASPDVVGASEVIVNVTRAPYEFSATFSNRGSRFLGPEQLGITAALNNAITSNDQTQVRVVNTPVGDPDQLLFGEVRHEEQLGGDGTKLVVSASHIETRPGFTLEPFDVVGESTALSVGVSYPYLRSRRSNLFLNSTFTARNVDVNTLDADLFLDKTRVLSVGTAYDFVDELSAINRLEVNVAKGFGFGTDVENQPSSRANGEESFWKFTASTSRIQPIEGPWSAFVALTGQHSTSALLASEEFALGGEQFGSAYDAAEVTGDSGAAARLELQYNETSEGWLTAYQLYGFYDIGRVWNRNPIAGSEDATASLSSTGVGARFNLEESLSGSLELALPLTRKVAAFGEDGSAPRVFFNLQYRY